MAPLGSAPFSSILYLTKRKRLSDQLMEHKNNLSQENRPHYYENIFYPSHKSENYTKAGVYKNLVHLCQDRLKYESTHELSLDVDDGLNRGLNYLSRYSDVVNLAEVDEFSRSYHFKRQPEQSFVGKVEDIANVLDLKDFTNNGAMSSDPLERHLELSDRYVGPLNVSEVGNLIVLAMKLQESEKLDLDLEKRLEVSAQMWKNNRVPTTVSNMLISSLFKNRPFQCESCGLRFSLHDTLKRHELTHKSKSDKFWYSLEGWVQLTSKGAFGFTYTRSQVTLETFRGLLRESSTEDECVVWLRTTLFPNEQAMAEVVMAEEAADQKQEVDEDMGPGTAEGVGDETTLWAWAIMDSCPEAPGSGPREEDLEPGEVDADLFKQMLGNVAYNLFAVGLNKPVVGPFGDMARSSCVVCQDVLHFEFDVKYNKFLYVNTASFQLDLGLCGRMFPEPVPLAHILSLDNLDSLGVAELIKKMAALRVVWLDPKSKRELAITDWSFKHTRQLLDIETSVTRMDDIKYADRLVRGWRNPFKAKGAGSEGLLYAHTCCLKLVLNAHLRWAKLRAGALADGELAAALRRLQLA